MKHRKISNILSVFFLSTPAMALSTNNPTLATSIIPQEQGIRLGKKNPLNFTGKVSESMAENIIKITKELYSKEANSRNESLVINLLWDESDVNAGTNRSWGTAKIEIYGGLVRYSHATPDFVAATLCHEIGHLYAGSPQFPGEDLSAEGQSDYYIAKQCMFDVMSRYATTEPPTQDASAIARCGQFFNTTSEDVNNPTQNILLCRRTIEAAKVSAIMFTEDRDEVTPNMTTPADPTVVTSTLLDYPATAQCRFDTTLAGMFGTPRPKCWYAGDNSNDDVIPFINNKIVTTKETFLKKAPKDDTLLSATQKCALPAGSVINYNMRSLENGHYKINVPAANTLCPNFTGMLYISMPYANEIYPSS